MSLWVIGKNWQSFFLRSLPRHRLVKCYLVVQLIRKNVFFRWKEKVKINIFIFKFVIYLTDKTRDISSRLDKTMHNFRQSLYAVIIVENVRLLLSKIIFPYRYLVLLRNWSIILFYDFSFNIFGQKSILKKKVLIINCQLNLLQL